MSEMKPLVSCYNLLTWISVCPPEEETSQFKRYIFKAIAMLFVLSTYTTMAPSAVFFWQYVLTDLKGSLYALFQISGLLGSINAIFVIIFFHHKIDEMFDSLKQIYDKCKSFQFEYIF